VSGLYIPPYVGIARVKGQLESRLALSVYAQKHHDAILRKMCGPAKMEGDSHVVFVVSGLETSDVDETVAAHTIAVIRSIERRLSVISHESSLAVDGRGNVTQGCRDDGGT
jgi:hypothetical protein